jgi:tRNA(fMet)-specific endonuclease VapC
VILDTGFLIDLRRPEPAAAALARELESGRVPQRVSVLTLFELQTGLRQYEGSAEDAGRMLAVARSKDVLGVTPEIALKAGRLHGDLRAAGREVDSHDCLIAATALDREEAVVTRNTDHFERFDGLAIREY